MPHEHDLSEHFAAILGKDLIDPTGGVIVLRDTTGHYSFSPEGQITSREIGTTGNSTKACGAVGLLDVCGVAATGSDGTVEFLLSDFFCGEFGIFSRVNFLATPLSSAPVFVTVQRTVIVRDVRIKVFSWNADGRPAPGIAFDWRCRVPTQPIID
jgi:hypothetical protein